jgi:putative ABC transport system permease protein
MRALFHDSGPMGSRAALWYGLLYTEAIRSIARHKTRTALTVLSVAIGVAAVVWVVGVGLAGVARAEAQLQALGNNLVWVEAGTRSVTGLRTGSHGTTSLTIEDAQAILDEVPLLASMTPQIDGTVLAVSATSNWTTHYRGVSRDFLEIRRWPLSEGTVFTAEDEQSAANVCLLGASARARLFGAADPIGQVIRVGSQPFRVLGMLSIKGQSASGTDQDDTIVFPYTTAQKKIRGGSIAWLDDVICSAATPEAVEPAIAQVTELMRQRHHIRPGEDDDFNIKRIEEPAKVQIAASQTFALLLGTMATISLLVGGIGIMNMMLASVTERTTEIGLRLAVGAPRRAVWAQFLAEAVVTSLAGGLSGVAMSLAGSRVLGRVLGWTVGVDPQAIVVALVLSLGVSVFFGFFPARRAARLDPIAALRGE